MADASRFQPGRSEQWTERERVGAGCECVDVGDADGDLCGRDGRWIPRAKTQSEGARGVDWRRADGFANAGAHVADAECGRGEAVEQHCECRAAPCDSRGEGREYANDADGRRWWESEPDVGRVAHGVADRVDRLKALGNGQVPLQAALAWRILTA